MSAGDDILLIVVFYFPPFSSQLVEPHLLPSLSQVESLPAPPLPTPLRCLLIVWAWRRIISPVSILLLLEVNPPHPEMIHLTSLGQSRTSFCSTDKVSFDLVPKWTSVFKTWTLSGEKKSITSRLKWHSSRVRRPHNVSEVAVIAYALWLFNQCTIYIFTITTVAWSKPECARCTLRLHGLE